MGSGSTWRLRPLGELGLRNDTWEEGRNTFHFRAKLEDIGVDTGKFKFLSECLQILEQTGEVEGFYEK